MAICTLSGRYVFVAIVAACFALTTNHTSLVGVTVINFINTYIAQQKGLNMKGGQNFRELQDKKKAQVEDVYIHQPVCMVCNRKCEGFYARFGESGTCDSKCMKVQDTKPVYPGHSSEDYERKYNLWNATTAKKISNSFGVLSLTAGRTARSPASTAVREKYMQVLVQVHMLNHELSPRQFFRAAYQRFFSKDITEPALVSDISTFDKTGKVPNYLTDYLLSVYGAQ